MDYEIYAAAVAYAIAATDPADTTMAGWVRNLLRVHNLFAHEIRFTTILDSESTY